MPDGKIKLCVFADLHYKYMMYSATVKDLETILKRAHDNNADFVIHCGDFSNDYTGSPELWKTYLNNKYNLPVYGIYGNHELESMYNSMQFVTPKITNDENVVWGTDDGKIGDGSIAYYHFDRDGFRIICTDTNYSFNYGMSDWEHNRTCSWGLPDGNGAGDSLAPKQLSWLEKVLDDAADKGLKCIVFSHAGFSGIWASSHDAERVRELFNSANAKRKGTVLMAINGHYHTNTVAQKDDIVYFDLNTVKNGRWMGKGSEHYKEEHTFDLVEYDDEGNPISFKKESLNNLGMGKNTWFLEDPLSAIIEIETNGHIVIDGMKTNWCYGVEPEDIARFNKKTEILSAEFNVLV